MSPTLRRVLITLVLIAVLAISAAIIIRNGTAPALIGGTVGFATVLIVNNRLRKRRVR